MNSSDLRRFATQVRGKFLEMHFHAKAGHIGSGLSSIDLLAYIYKIWLREEDTFILSKGHGASALYATLYALGRISDELMEGYYKEGTLFPAHPAALAHPDIPVATGSLGHGLPIANGIAYAARHVDRDRNSKRVACLLSDGECDEGSVWEAALFAGHHRLGNLTVIVDANGLQGFGYTKEVMNLEPLERKFQAFGFACAEANGHDFDDLAAAFSRLEGDRPKCLLARTVKGKGVSFMENKMEWHYKPMSEAEYALAVSEQQL